VARGGCGSPLAARTTVDVIWLLGASSDIYGIHYLRAICYFPMFQCCLVLAWEPEVVLVLHGLGWKKTVTSAPITLIRPLSGGSALGAISTAATKIEAEMKSVSQKFV